MRTLISVVFPDRDAAMAAVSALPGLEFKNVRIDTMHVIAKGEGGAVVQDCDEDDFPPPSGTVAGLVLGGLLGALFRWPMGAAVGAGIGTMIGLLRDWYESASRRNFTAAVGSALKTGQYAVLLETKQDSAPILDVEMERLGGIVSRTPKRAAVRAHRSQQIMD
jgi:uncharacterized membrane protein